MLSFPYMKNYWAAKMTYLIVIYITLMAMHLETYRGTGGDGGRYVDFPFSVLVL